MKVVQINSVCGVGSTGRIAVDISKKLNKLNIENYIFYGVGKSKYPLGLKIGNQLNVRSHQIGTRILGKHGFYSKHATIQLVRKLKKVNPEIIHLHNLHGHYLNVEILFKYLSKLNKKVIWTLHDCWSFTGHCSHFDFIGCNKWKRECHSCPQLKEYPISLIFDRSKESYLDKKRIFTSVDNMTIVTPSKWLNDLVNQSFLGKYPVEVINNGIDLDVFLPVSSTLREKNGLNNKFIILGVASSWSERKGLSYFSDLAKKLSDDHRIVLIGVNESQKKALPNNIICIERTENIQALAEWYSTADLFLNPTLEDNFPTVNIEALACGTPVITFNTGGSAESIDNTCGIIVEKGNSKKLFEAINLIKKIKINKEDCINRSITFDKNDRYLDYYNLYTRI